MGRLVSVLVLIAAAGAAVYFALRGAESDSAAAAGPVAASRPDGGPGDPAPLRADGVAPPKKAAPTEAPAADPGALPPLFGGGRNDDAMAPERIADRLGWEAGDADAQVVGEWLREQQTEQTELLAGVEGPDGREQARHYNEVMDRHRESLVERLGVERADAVLRRFPIYRFDLDAGSWHRVDAKGERAAFQGDAEDVWQGFVRRDG